jgi:serine/threonine protein phosphatase PrpC
MSAMMPPPSSVRPQVPQTAPSMVAPVASPSPALLPGGPLHIDASARSHVGTVRTRNEDQYLVANLTSAMEVVRATSCAERTYFGRKPASLFVVADGMGGHAAGEKASAIALASVETFVLDFLARLEPVGASTPTAMLEGAFRRADEAVHDQGQSRERLRGMGTTMTMALFQGRTVHLAHAGDSRAYLLRDGKLFRMTRDHTLVAELEAKGLLTPEQVDHHPLKHVVTNVIGGGTLGVTPEISIFPVKGGDRLLLCSDGLFDALVDAEIDYVLQTSPTPGEACGQLVDHALKNAAKDNVTALVVSFQEQALPVEPS